MTHRFVIIGIFENGIRLELFTWCRCAISGIQRGYKDAADFDFEFKEIIAEPIN